MIMKREHLLNCHIAGFTYYSGLEMIEQLKVGTKLELKRDKKNRYDPQAIKIKCNGAKIGFIPRVSNDMIYKLLKIGFKGLECVVTRVNTDTHTENMLHVAVFLVAAKKVKTEEV